MYDRKEKITYTNLIFTVKAKDAAGNISDASDVLKICIEKEQPQLTNKALNKKATSSEALEGFEACKAVDGKIEAGFSS